MVRLRVAWCLACCAVASLAWHDARADSPTSLPSDANLDGTYITLGPVAAAARVQGAWLSAVGGELSVVHLVEHHLPAALGVDLGGVSYTGRSGGRFWLEGEVGVQDLLPAVVGLSAGAAYETTRSGPAHGGVQGTLWVYFGAVLYARAGTLFGEGEFVEFGAMLKIPAHHFP